MARIRTVKPGLWTHEDLSALPLETHVLAAALLNYADDEGYFNANPKLILAACFPLRELSRTIPLLLRELVTIGYVRIFKGTDGKSYGHVCKFAQHQVVNRPRVSAIKVLEESGTNHGIINEPSLPEWNGMEGNGIENGSTPSTKTAKTKLTPLAEDFLLTPGRKTYALGKGIRNPDAEFEKFRARHKAKGSKFVDWDSAWQYWVRTSIEFQSARSPANGDFQASKKLDPALYQDQ